jgi:acyl-CoA thioesterase
VGLQLDSILAALDLQPVDDNRYRAANIEMGHAVVFGGQLMAQSIVAAAAGSDGKRVKTLHTVFARGGVNELPLDIEVDPTSRGRSIATTTVTISQEGRVCTRSMVLLSTDEPDVIRHADPAPDLAAPDDGEATEEWQIKVVDDVDINDPEAVGPPELDVWTRFPGAPEDPLLNQALLGFATDGFLIGTAMRPHPGVGQAQAHKTLSTGVLSHTITFHEPFSASEWLLLSHRSPYAGRGRSYGQAAVYRPDGQLVASYVQDNMIRTKGGSGPL